MPEELSANIKELAEKKEDAKGDEVETTEEPPHKWTIRDDVKIIGIIVFMYAVLALMFYLAVTLMKHVDECRVCFKQVTFFRSERTVLEGHPIPQGFERAWWGAAR